MFKEAQDRYLFVLLLLSLLVSFALILRESGTVPAWPMDQHFVSTVDLRLGRSEGHWVFHYPILGHAGGITPSVIAGAYKLLIPTSPQTLNWHIRALSAALYLVSAYLLCKTIIKAPSLRPITLIVIATSGSQILQPSSEVIAGGLLGLFIVCAMKRYHPLLSAGFLVAFGLCKIELLLSIPALTLAWYLYQRRVSTRRATIIPIAVLAWFALLVLPGLVVHGPELLGVSRSFLTFSITYNWMFAPHQFSGYVEPANMDWTSFAAAQFPGANSVLDVIQRFPTKYLHFFSICFFESLLTFIETFRFMLIPMALLIVSRCSIPRLRFPIMCILALVIFTLLPASLLTWIHVRYLARYVPLVLCVVAAGCSEIQLRYAKPTFMACGWLTIVIQLINLDKLSQGSHFY